LKSNPPKTVHIPDGSDILKLYDITEENVHLQKMMASIIDEAGARVKEEVESLKQLYNKKLEVLVHDMKKMEDVGNCCTQNR
jgi:intergrase/recombinase